MATGWALSRMVEEHICFINVQFRWLDDANFDKGPRQYFAGTPAAIRPIFSTKVKRKQHKTLCLHGLGRHGLAELRTLAAGDVTDMEDTLADKPFLYGSTTCGADVSVSAFL